MLGEIKEYGKFYCIKGYRNVKLGDVRAFMEKIRERTGRSFVQLFNAEVIATWEHLFFAALNVMKAFREGRNISKREDIELLLYASAQRQIDKAIKIVGLKPETDEVALLILSDQERWRDETLSNLEEMMEGVESSEVLSLNTDKIRIIKREFRITDGEIEAAMRGESLEEALKGLVIERMALLPLQK